VSARWCVCSHPNREHRWQNGYRLCTHVFRPDGAAPWQCDCWDFVEDDSEARLEAAQQAWLDR